MAIFGSADDRSVNDPGRVTDFLEGIQEQKQAKRDAMRGARHTDLALALGVGGYLAYKHLAQGGH